MHSDVNDNCDNVSIGSNGGCSIRVKNVYGTTISFKLLFNNMAVSMTSQIIFEYKKIGFNHFFIFFITLLCFVHCFVIFFYIVLLYFFTLFCYMLFILYIDVLRTVLFA